jgi:hypothetical protein
MTFQIGEKAILCLWTAINYLSTARRLHNEEDRLDLLLRAQFMLTSFAAELHRSQTHPVSSYSSPQQENIYSPNGIAKR